MKNSQKGNDHPQNQSRRNFIKYSTLGSIAATFAPKILSANINKLISPFQNGKSKIVIIKHSKVVNANGLVDFELAKEMINKGILQFTGKDSLKDAWSLYFSNDDVIGLKLSTLGLNNISGTDFTSHFSAVTNAVVNSLQQGGFNEGNIIAWDRSDEELASAGLTIQKEEGKFRIFGHHSDRRTPSIGYTEQTFPVGDKSSHISKILYDMCTALINIPIPKHHSNAGLTCALKSHYGTIDNARDFHANGCTNPGIPEVNMIPVIREKQKLIICDALVGLMEGGPRWNAQYAFPYGAVMFATDPVALDSVAMNIIDEKRKSADLPLLKDRVEYLKMSQDLGLGNCEMKDIDVIEINLG